MLDVRLKFYEREKNIRMNILRKQQHQMERTRTSLDREATRLQLNRLSSRPSTAWVDRRSTPAVDYSPPELVITEWEVQPREIQQENVPSSNKLVVNNGIRPHSAR
jgi:hypothetical protein